MLYLRAIELKNAGNKKEPNRYLKCMFSASKNKYAKTYPVNIFENGSDEPIFVALSEDFGIDTEDELVRVDCDETFEGELFTADVVPHKIMIGDEVSDAISTTLTTIYVTDWGQTKESVIRSFERTWKKNDLIVEEVEEQWYWGEGKGNASSLLSPLPFLGIGISTI